MDIYAIYTIFLVLLILYILLDNKNLFIKNKLNYNKLKSNQINYEKNNIYLKNKNYKPANINIHNHCQVPTLNTEQCYKSKYNKCSNIDGNYSQCTNNNMPNNLHGLCENRSFEMTSPENKISENCDYLSKK